MTSGRSGWRLDVDLVDHRTDGPGRHAPAKSAPLSTISSIGRPMPPSLTMMTGASSNAATRAFESPTTAPTPACPVPSTTTTSLSAAIRWYAARDLGAEIVVDAAHGVVGREVARQGDRRHVVERIGKPESLAHQHGVLVGARPVDDEVALSDQLQEAQAQATLADRGQEADARGRLAAGLAGRGQEDALGGHVPNSPSRLRATLDEVDALAQSGRGLGVDHLGLEVIAESSSSMSAATLRSTSASAMKNWGSLLSRTSVRRPWRVSPASVCETCMPKLWPWMPSGLFRKFSALSMTSPKRARHEDESLLDLEWQADLAELLEDTPVDEEEADPGRAGTRTEHHLQGALEGEDVGVESRALS